MKGLFTLCTSIGPFSIALAGAGAPVSKDTLATIENPVERFAATIAYLEHEQTAEGARIDSTMCLDLLNMATRLKSDSMLAISYNWIGSYMGENGKVHEEIEFYFKALPLAEKHNDKRRISSIYFDLASAYYALGKRLEAYDFIAKAKANLPDPSLCG